jgi:hypothetical protein
MFRKKVLDRFPRSGLMFGLFPALDKRCVRR